MWNHKWKNQICQILSSVARVRMTVAAALKPKGNTGFITILEHAEFPFLCVLAQTPQLEDAAI